MRSQRQYMLDAGALIRIEAQPRGPLLAQLIEAVARQQIPLLPAVVLAQVWRDEPRQHSLARLRRIARILPFTEDTAKQVGRLMRLSGTDDVVDAAVVVAAIEHNAAVVTSDPADLTKLADAAGFPVPLIEA